MKLLLATLHSRYVHNSLALPCLAASCGVIEGLTLSVREFTVNEPFDRVLREVVEEGADVAAFSCYIWNITETLRLAADLKKLCPETFIILGGPEASYGAFDLMARNPAIDCVVRGEGEETMMELMDSLSVSCGNSEALRCVTAGIFLRDGEEIVSAPERPAMKDMDCIPSPFSAGLADLSKPLVYYESSRGCPFSCAFCISSLDREVRSFSMERIEEDLGILMARGAQTVKFVDRTFNYDAKRANRIWEFILRENRESRFHFEIAADLLTEENFRLLKRVPAGLFRFEIGIQSGREESLERVGRKSDMERLCANVGRLREETGVIVHLDLVAGLPGEDMSGFLRSLGLLFDLVSDENKRPGKGCHIQIEILKVLKGSPMRRIAAEEGYLFSDAPPYRVLSTPWLSYGDVCRIETIARLVDLVYNGDRFLTALTSIAETRNLSRFFSEAARYWEEARLPTSLSRNDLFEALWRYGENYLPVREAEAFRDALCFDFCLGESPPPSALPPFFRGKGEWGKGKDIPADIAVGLGIAAGSRVRSFRYRFARDYLDTPWGIGPVEFMFVYISAPGKGLRVEAVRPKP